MRKALLTGLTALILASGVGEARAAQVTQADGNGDVDVSYNKNDQEFTIFADLVNNNTATEYESGLTKVFDSAVDTLYKTARNKKLYATKEDFILGENLNITLGAGGGN